MAENRKYILCGGTFLVLLFRARKQRVAARKKAGGESDGLSDSEVFTGLIQVAFPDFVPPAGRSMKTYTTNYKNCTLSSNEILPFEKDELIEAFDKSVKEDYHVPLGRMKNFIERYIDDKNMGNWLVRAVLEVVEHDDIQDELFYIADSDPYDKKHLMDIGEIVLPSFLLGIWHFIILNRRDNKAGRATYEMWHKKPETLKGRWEFVGDIGKNWVRQVNVTLNITHSIHKADMHGMSERPGNLDVPEDMDAVAFMDGIAPELTGNPSFVLVPKGILTDNGEFEEYLENAREKYGQLKTLLYNDAPRKFYDFYVCNNISQKVYIKKYTYITNIIPNATAELLKGCSNFILISGTGGLGKSMMMRHLLLTAIENYEDGGQIPIFIPLKDYSDTYTELREYVFEKFDSLGGNRNEEEFEELLEEGRCLLLFDGLDEIKSDYRKVFERDLDVFSDKYTDNMFVISSRPIGSFISFHRFTVLDLCPFTKEQALELIDKLDFRPDEPAIKERFMDELKTKLFISHREFTENPLLLTIMLMTYEQFAEIPSKMHVFYREAYTALSQKHDASKGAFKRVLKTGLSADRFAEYFAEFCARTYRDEKFEFTDVLFDKYFNEMNEHTKSPSRVTASDFRDDLVENMCLMYYESGKYHFTHRSFQEYFCALYFSGQKDRTLGAIGDFFETKSRRLSSDKTFSMLYDMIPDKIDEYIFEPFLEKLFKECDENKGYWTFLERMYPILYYEKGESGDCTINKPDSFLYDFIITKESIYGWLGNDDLPEDEAFLTNEWVYLDDDYENPDIDTNYVISVDEVPYDYKLEFGEPEIVGRNYEIEIKTICDSPESYGEVIALLESEAFPLMSEYNEVRDYLRKLQAKRSEPGDDLFDLFK